MGDLREELHDLEERLADGAVLLLQQWHLHHTRRLRGQETESSQDLLDRLTESQQQLSIRRDELRAALASTP